MIVYFEKKSEIATTTKIEQKNKKRRKIVMVDLQKIRMLLLGLIVEPNFIVILA